MGNLVGSNGVIGAGSGPSIGGAGPEGMTKTADAAKFDLSALIQNSQVGGGAGSLPMQPGGPMQTGQSGFGLQMTPQQGQQLWKNLFSS